MSTYSSKCLLHVTLLELAEILFFSFSENWLLSDSERTSFAYKKEGKTIERSDPHAIVSHL
jgi:hypothetical protein